ncbi:MAG: 5'-nucleotidase C-terminal domain-containing protein [Gemmatimonadetes bacterium]|nr:5'-nucleotidase C-terminal domain-containing protein [Gemmatimonadota bacterium]
MTTLRRIIRPRALAYALLLAALPAGAQEFRPAATFVQINDVYRIDAVENGTAGGIGRVVTVVERARRATGAPVRVLHAGDFIAPSLESRYFEGQQMIDALNFLDARAPLIVVPGNHEFDERRPGMLVNAINASRFPWLAANVRLNTGDPQADRRLGADTVIESGGMRIGVFTLTFLDSPRDYATWDTAFVALARQSIQALEARGVDAIVGLTHLDLSVDRRIAALRGAHPKLMWIAGGHEHFLIHDPLTDSTAAITKGDSNARRIWQVVLGRRGGQPALRADSVVLDASVAIDPAYVREVQAKWAARLREKVPFFDQVIGRSATRMDASEEVVRNQESAWGNWLADQMRTAFPTVPADVAVLNGGAIRIDDVIQGEIRWEHLARTFGFPTRVALVWLRGRDLRETVLERSVSGGRGEGRFLQVSGLRFTFDRTRPVNQRVTSVQVQAGTGWEPLDDNRVYVVAVPDYLFGGGDGYLFHNRAILSVPPGPDLRLLAFDALSAAYARGEAIAPAVEGRITEAGGER